MFTSDLPALSPGTLPPCNMTHLLPSWHPASIHPAPYNVFTRSQLLHSARVRRTLTLSNYFLSIIGSLQHPTPTTTNRTSTCAAMESKVAVKRSHPSPVPIHAATALAYPALGSIYPCLAWFPAQTIGLRIGTKHYAYETGEGVLLCSGIIRCQASDSQPFHQCGAL